MAGAADGAWDRLKAPTRFHNRRWMGECRRNPEANRLFCARRKPPRNSADRLGRAFSGSLRSAKGPRCTPLFRHLHIVGKQYRLVGGEVWIRTPETFVDLEGQIVRRTGSLFGPEISLCSVEVPFRPRFARKSDAISYLWSPLEGHWKRNTN